jgi:hypothetical protein
MRTAIILSLAAAAVLAQDLGEEAVEKAKQVTVMINATIDGDTRPGAGIIFGIANNQIYIATANHLLRHGVSKATEIQVEFQWLPGQPIPAQLLTYYDDRALDLAVLAVESAKAHVPPAGLSLDRLGDPAMLSRGASLSAIGYPNGAAFDVSAAQVNQVEAVLLKYRVAGLVPGGYSGGPLVDSGGSIVGIIRQDQPPNGEATRIDLVINQLKAWSYQVALREPGSSPPRATSNQSPVESAAPTAPAPAVAAPEPVRSSGTADPFSDVLLRYVAEAPSGFQTLRADDKGGWTPAVIFPGSIRCTGGGPSQFPFIECVLFRSKDRAAAQARFVDIVGKVERALPTWKKEDIGQNGNARFYFSNASSSNQSTVSVDTSVLLQGTNYDVYLAVQRIKPQ